MARGLHRGHVIQEERHARVFIKSKNVFIEILLTETSQNMLKFMFVKKQKYQVFGPNVDNSCEGKSFQAST